MDSLIFQLYANEDSGREWEGIKRTSEDVQRERERIIKFTSMLTCEQLELYEQLRVDFSKLLAYKEQEGYARGFRSGAKMMMEILAEDD